MTPQEIINEIQKLSPLQQKEVLDRLSLNLTEENALSEAEVAERLLAKGVINEIPDGWDESDDEDDFEPIVMKGKPLSETVIEDRR
jgi:hypothetical protein